MLAGIARRTVRFLTLHPIIAGLVILIPLLQGCASDSVYVQINGTAQGGQYSIKCKTDFALAPGIKDGVDSILRVIDNSLSGYNPGSVLSRINDGQDITDSLCAEYRLYTDMCHFSDSICTATLGAVDCSAATLFDVWGFGFKGGGMPADSTVFRAMCDHSRRNFNAVAQGYSCDLVAGYLKSRGISEMMVEIGGEIYCSGLSPRGTNWTVGIDEPTDGNMSPGADVRNIFAVPQTDGCGVVTSGNYRKFYVRDGVKYSHTIDPRTGRPVTHNLLSATILAPTAALADALATYCMVVGMDEASRFIEERPDLDGCLISSDSVWYSSGLKPSRL